MNTAQQLQAKKVLRTENETHICIAAKQKYGKPSNKKEYDVIRLLITRPLFANFDYVCFETCFKQFALFSY